jgi:predicted DNA-binding transcriptional regulator AlpA
MPSCSFPAPVRLGPRAVGWRWSDLDQWTNSRPDTH